MLVNYRPEYRHEWGSRTYYTQLRLDRLGAESAREMLDTLLGSSADAAELSPLKRLIIEKTEGNRFFMEETVQVLLDEGALVRNGTVKLTKALGDLRYRQPCKRFWPRASIACRRKRRTSSRRSR